MLNAMKTTLQTLFFSLVLVFAFGFKPTDQSTDKLMMEQICSSRPVLKETLKQAGLAPLLMDPGPYTFFAPSDETLQKLQNADPGKLKEIFMNHLVAGKLMKEDFKDGSKIMTLGGKELSVFRKKNELLINGALVTDPDIITKNGIIHTVNNLVVTPM